MGANSKIEWTHHTFNCWRGCTKVAPECDHCYAEIGAKRFPDRLGIWGNDGTRVVAAESMWAAPLAWDRAAAKAGERHRVFCASLADVFEDWHGQMVDSHGNVSGYKGMATMAQVRANLFALIDATPNLDWLLLTKRPENIRRMTPPNENHGCATGDCPHDNVAECTPCWRHNVWLGTSAGTQATADSAIPELLKCRDLAPVLFVSAEPLLEAVDFTCYFGWFQCQSCFQHCFSWDGRSRCCDAATARFVDWVIAGGESGRGVRPMNPDWARSLRDQCVAAGVPFFFKQWGEWAPPEQLPAAIKKPAVTTTLADGSLAWRVGKSAAGRILDGRTWEESPNEPNP